MKRQAKLSQQQAHDAVAGHETLSGGAMEFSSAEEMLRHDAAQSIVPPNVGVKLRASLADSRVEKVSWWKRILGG